MQGLELDRQTNVFEADTATIAPVVCESHSTWSKGWCARLTGAIKDLRTGRIELERLFLNAALKQTSRHGNGDKVYELTEPGLYEADSVWRSLTSHRVLFLFDGTSIEVLADTVTTSQGALKAQAVEHLKNSGCYREKVSAVSEYELMAAQRAIETAKRVEEQKIKLAAAEREQAVIRREAVEAERLKQEKLHEKKMLLGQQFSDLLQLKYKVQAKIWKSQDQQDVRLYVSYEFSDNEIEYYYTGNSKNKPDSLILRKAHEPHRDQLTRLCAKVCKEWNMIRFEVPAVKNNNETIS